MEEHVPNTPAKHMLNDTDTRVLNWASEVIGKDRAILGPPVLSGEQEAIRFHLLDIANEPVARNHTDHRFTFWLRYLVTAHSSDISTGHGLLGDLLFAALQNADLQVEREPLSPATWHALGVPPQASFQFRIQACKEIPVRPPKMVRKVTIETVLTGSLHGKVLGPEDAPITDAFLELPQLHASTYTDRDGSFAFTMIPETGLKTLLVRAKGRDQTFDISTHPIGSPLLLRFELEE